jgi:hypothetical protein
MEAKSNNDLDQAYNLVLAQKYAEGITLAEKYFQNPDPAYVLMAYTIAAIGYFRDQKYASAKEFYKKCADMTNDNQDWFNLCTSATLAKDISLGAIAYKKAVDPVSTQTSDLSFPQITYFYAQALADAGEMERATEIIYKLKPFYVNAFVTDPYFLTERGMPLLYDLIDVVRKIYAGTKNEAVLDWLDDLALKIDEEGKEEIAKFRKEL